MAYFENFWNCPQCGQRHISALRKLKCPNCGSQKVPSSDEYMGGEITDSDGLELAEGGPHWTCRFCGSVNLDKYETCQDCGHGKDEKDNNMPTIDYGTTPPREETHSESHSYTTPSIAGEPVPDMEATYNFFEEAQGKHKRKRKPKNDDPIVYSRPSISLENLKPILAIIAVISIVAGIAFLIFHTNPVQGRVTGYTWTRDVVIDRYQTVREEDWTIPGGGRYVSEYRAIHHYDPVYETRTRRVSKTCYQNNGNGSSSSYDCSYTETYQQKVRDDPVYRTKYVYDIDKFVYNRTERATANDHTPYWPKYTLALEGQIVIGAERVSSTPQTYVVHFVDINDKEHKTYDYGTSEAEWNQYGIEQTFTLQVNAFGAIMNNPLTDKLKEQSGNKQ